jgi:hypothetical protein
LTLAIGRISRVAWRWLDCCCQESRKVPVHLGEWRMTKNEPSSLCAVSASSVNREAHVDAVRSAWSVLAILPHPDITQSRRRYPRTDVPAAGPSRRNFVALSHLHRRLSHLEYAPTTRDCSGAYMNASSNTPSPPPHAAKSTKTAPSSHPSVDPVQHPAEEAETRLRHLRRPLHALANEERAARLGRIQQGC